MNQLIDSRNQNLWDDLSNKFNISIENSFENNYGCYAQNDNVVLYVTSDNLCKDSFTHELLHVYLRSKDCYIGASLTNFIIGDYILSSILSKELIEHIGNSMDHIKMLPLYLEMGFDRKLFIADYNLYKITNEEIQQFESFYRNEQEINLSLVDPYIGRIVAIIADPNDNFDYTADLMRLKQIDSELFEIIKKMFDHWKEIKLDDRKIWDDDYRTVTFNFYEDIKKWMSNNNIK
ncbi:hypothetical protein [Flavobacterium limi]|uniref:IrrE N-terminal-like domain-containing protein n=1 Tax=Flavobacterium limi TaxID=2045105 RepID=A0ABQ1UVB4_9FLAO|nr:hypothetical protein [Flavobacterium limi]GGF28019.1 hypothetical protein GCM10011518_41670 [Flavobacterium limi]